MRLLALILLILYGLQGIGQASLDRTVTMDYEEEKLDYIFSHLQNTYGVSIRFNEANLSLKRNTYSFDNIPLIDALKIICRDNQLAFTEYDADKIIVFPNHLQGEEEGASRTDLELSRRANSDSSGLQIVLGDIQPVDAGADARILGFLMDKEQNNPIANAMILNLTSGDFDISDNMGQFQLELPTGKYDVQITSITHETHTVTIDVKGSDQWMVELSPKAHMIDEIVISGQSEQAVIKETISGLEELGRREIKQLSSFMGEADVVKSLLTVAGVSTIGEGASGFNVRGGSIDQNLILQDGILILNPSHILGFFSTFNPDIVLNTALNKGHIPAQYGGRISSVLDVDIVEADYDNFRLSGSIGIISAKTAAEIPVVKGKSSLLVSGRLAYAGWLKSNVEDLDIKNSQARFDDLHVKYSHRLTDRDKIIASYFQSFDKFRFSREFGYSWQNRIAGVQYKRIQGEHLSFSVNAALGALNNNQFEPAGPLAFDLRSGMHYKQVKAQTIYEEGNHVIRVGGEWIDYDTSPERLSPLENSQTPGITVIKERGREWGFYFNDQWDLHPNLSVDIGLRFSHFQQLGPGRVNQYGSDVFFDERMILGTSDYAPGEVIASYSGLEPRISMRLSLHENVSLKASFNRLNQYLHLLSNATSPTPVDIWQVSNTHLGPVTATNYSLGLFHKLSRSLDYSVDIYYRNLDNTLDHRDFADLLLQEHLETAVLKGRGRAYGTEFSIRKSGDVLSGRLSYSYARSERKTDKTQEETINSGAWFPSNFDQPHTVKLFLNWKLSRRDRFDINFTYSSGRPITAPNSNYFIQGVIVPGFTQRNAVRLPAYHRLDIGYTFTMNRRRSARYKHEFTLALYNLYARRNVFSVFYRQQVGTAINALQLSVVGTVIPSVTYTFKY